MARGSQERVSEWAYRCPVCGSEFACVEVDTVDGAPPDSVPTVIRPGPMVVECRQGHSFSVACAEYSVDHGYRFRFLSEGAWVANG